MSDTNMNETQRKQAEERARKLLEDYCKAMIEKITVKCDKMPPEFMEYIGFTRKRRADI